jgi:hypothetical protein
VHNGGISVEMQQLSKVKNSDAATAVRKAAPLSEEESNASLLPLHIRIQQADD